MAKLMEGGAVKSSGTARKPSFKGSRTRRKTQSSSQEDDEGFRTKSVREVIRIFESRHQGARVVAVKRQDANAKPSDAVILVRRSSKPRSRVKPVLHPKPARLSLPKDLSLLDQALETEKPRHLKNSLTTVQESADSRIPSINPSFDERVSPKNEPSSALKTTSAKEEVVDKLELLLKESTNVDKNSSSKETTPPPDAIKEQGTCSETIENPPQTFSVSAPQSSSLYKITKSSSADIETSAKSKPAQESQNTHVPFVRSTSLYKIIASSNSSKECSPTEERTPIEETISSIQQLETPNNEETEPQPKSSTLYRLLKQTSVESSVSSSTLTPSEVENDILSAIEAGSDDKIENTTQEVKKIHQELPELPRRPLIPTPVPIIGSKTNSFYENYDSYENKDNFEENNYEVIDDDLDGEAIYDDVVNLRSEGLYEIIYTSQNDSDGSVDQRNSIYGMRPPSEASTGSSGGQGSGNSDDWVDVEEEISKDKIKRERILVCTYESEQEDKQIDLPNSKFYCNYREGCSDESDTGAHYESVQVVDDDSALCDDFSDDTDSESESLSSGKTTPNTKLQNGRGSNGSVHKEESIYCLLREAGKKTWTKSLQWVSKISSQANQDEKSLNGKWLTLNKKNKALKRRHKSMSTFYISKDSSPEPPPVPPPMIIAPDTRRHSAALRPTSPPPPPPPRINEENKKLSMRELVEASYSISYHSTNGTSIYSDDKRSDTSSEHGSSQGSDINLRFADEPLYQFYEAGVFEREKAELEVDEENYEELEFGRPTALDLVTCTQLNRTLWCQVPQVMSSGVLDTLNAAEKQLQEAKFELMTSEASYYKSLTVLEKHFAQSSQFKDVTILSKVDYRTLFSNVPPVRKCSELVLNALDKCWQESILLEGICDVVNALATQQFQTYVKYCKNQISIEKSLKKLKGSNAGFVNALTMLEKAEICHSLTLSSFLLLPMQRITRMPLLLDAILTKLTPNHPEYIACQSALAQLNKIVFECNEEARKTERHEELAALSRALVFAPPLKSLPLLSASRWLVRSGPVQHLNLEPRMTLTKRLTAKNQKLTLFLFTDYLIVAKKKGDDHYSVLDYCARNLSQMRKLGDNIPGKFLVELTMLENYEKKTQEMVICCGSESSRERWLAALSPPEPQNEGEVLYEDWDCPQVTALHPFTPTQPDELQLRSGDSVNVLRKLSDGWYYGERIRDGEKGWFPGNYTIEIASAHMRARNLKLRYRFLAITSSYIQKNMSNNASKQ